MIKNITKLLAYAGNQKHIVKKCKKKDITCVSGN